MGLQAFLAVPSEWPFKGTANLSASPSGLKFCAPVTGTARRGFSFLPMTGGLSLSRGQNKFEMSPPLGLNRPGPNFPKTRHPATPASRHQPSVDTGTGPGVAAPTEPTVTSDPWPPKSTQQTPLQVRVPRSQAPFFLHRRNFIPLEKNTEIQVKTVTCLKLSDILIPLCSTVVCLDTEHTSLSQAHPCPQQAGTL